VPAPTSLGPINEKSTGTLRLVLKDGAGVAVTSLSSATLWLRDLTSNTLIDNGIDALAAGGAVDGAGVFTFPVTSARTTAIGTPATQRRLVTIDFVFPGGRKTHELTFDVINLRDIT
jgi:hypothetical protein